MAELNRSCNACKHNPVADVGQYPCNECRRDILPKYEAKVITRGNCMKCGKGMLNCPYCGKKPIIEHWSSGGLMFMVKCNNPDCKIPVAGYPTGHNLDEVKAEWDKRILAESEVENENRT